MRVYGFLAVATICSLPQAQADCILGDCRNGTGTYVYASGARYDGQFVNSRSHGQGTLYFSNGDVYTGAWVNAYREGKGQLTFKNGDVYTGDFRKGKFHGIGTMCYHNADRYTGNWADGLPSGFGKYFFSTGERYEGDFVRGDFEGTGTMYYADGARYSGQWKANKKHGLGVLISPSGKQVSGEWVAGERLQEAPDPDATAESRPGQRNCNEVFCADGTGLYTYADGSRYAGTFVNGLPEGQGTVYYANGDRYEGGWSQHAPHGRGVLTFSNGRVFGGVWQYGHAVREEAPHRQERPQPDVLADQDPDVKIWAVVAGVGRYAYMPSLRYTDDDAYQMYAFLKSPEGGALPDNQVRILVDEEASHGNVLSALRQILLKADQNDVVLFYFSGHGLEGSFLPADFDGYNNRLLHTEVRAVLDQSQARHKIVLADACHSGSLLAMKSPVSSTIEMFYDAFANAKGGMALLMSSRSEEYSLEDGGLRSGIFSHFLIRGLKGEADIDRDKIVTIEELYNFIFRKVKDYTAGAQTPTLTGNYDHSMPLAVVR